MIELRGVQKSYRLGEETLQVLRGIDAKLAAGSFVALVGPSGCGKSTLLNLLGGLDRADSGQILVNGKDICHISEGEMEAYRLENIGTIFQSFNLIAHMTALENVEVPMTLAGIQAEERKSRARDLLAMVGLDDRAEHLPNQLSGGQKQRVAIARALALNPSIILADEPTGALDTKTGGQIIELLKEIAAQRGTTIVMVTHAPEIAAEADHVILMRDGEILKEERKREADVRRVPVGREKHKAMGFGTAMKHATANLRQKKWRTLLVSIGASIGITGIALMVGLGMGIEDRVKEELEAFVSQDAIQVYADAEKKKPLLGADLEKVAELEGVKGSYGMYQFMGGVVHGEHTVSDFIASYKPEEFRTEANKKEVLEGEFPEGEKEIAISEKTAKTLVGEGKATKELVGQEITVVLQNMSAEGHSVSKSAELKLTVSGVVKDGPFGMPNSGVSPELGQKMSKELDMKGQEAPISSNIVAKSVEDVEALKQKITDLGYTTSDDNELMKKISAYAQMAQAGLGFFAGISLVVSSIMIGIVLYISVLERTKEIGILRALGGRRKDIRRVFLTEAAVIGSFAGVIGVGLAALFGIAGNQVLEMILKEHAFQAFTLPLGLAGFCLLFSAVLSLFAGWVPARRAAKLNPIDALRHE